jgi:predicted nucleic-acid-binding Zn-ribbon protein
MKRQCIKCGSVNNKLQYIAKGDLIWVHLNSQAIKELLAINCKDCGYKWTEDTLDNILDNINKEKRRLLLDLFQKSKKRIGFGHEWSCSLIVCNYYDKNHQNCCSYNPSDRCFYEDQENE